MKLSELEKEQIAGLSDDLLDKLVYDGVYDDGATADVALLLGTNPAVYCKERAEKAAELYLAGRVKYIIPSGGVEHDYQGGKISEAHFMEKILLEKGVPEEAILLENEATTTKENMVCGIFVFTRRLKIQNVRSVMIVSSACHMRRSLGLAKLFMPRHVRICGCPAPDSSTGEHWTQNETVRRDVVREAQLMQGLIRQGLMDEIEY